MTFTFACSQCGTTGALPGESSDREQRCTVCGAKPDAVAMPDALPHRTILGMSVPVFAAVAVVLLCAGIPLVWLRIIAVHTPGHFLGRSMNQIRNLGIGIHNYARDNEEFLPTETNVYGEKQPLLSWRVHLLPYVEEGHLYDQFHLDEPWDSEHNKKLIEAMPPIYRSVTSDVADEGKTVYLAVTGPGTVFEKGTKVTLDVPDGASNTIILVEVSDERAVIWTKPDDYRFNPDRPMDGLMGQREAGFLVLTMNVSVHLVKPDFDQTIFKRLMLRNDGQPAEFAH